MPKTIKNGAYVINLDEYTCVCKRWIALYVKDIEVTYFDSFGIEHFPEEIEKLIKRTIGRKNMKTNIFILQANDSIMCGHFCIGFIDFMFVGETLIDYTSLFSPNDFNKNDDIILRYFKGTNFLINHFF